jgi:hypothetical protein
VLSFEALIEAVLVDSLPSQAPPKPLGRTLHPAAKTSIRAAASRANATGDKVRIPTL